MEMPEGFKLDYENYQKWLKLDEHPYLQVRAKEILPYMDLVLEMAAALENAIYYLDKEDGPSTPEQALKKFKTWKRSIERDPPTAESIKNLKWWLNK